jgi:CPA2 family monovalent cation:H+ antiporter-2
VHDLPLLVNVGAALGYALVGGLLARRFGLPTIVGYLVAGVALGPFAPWFHGDNAAIGQLAEVGVILLMFGVGLHFSLQDLWGVRRIAIPGSIAQMVVVGALGYAVSRASGFPPGASWILGLAISIASTVVLMRALMDHGWLTTPHGKVALGWLVFEDVLCVAILVLLPGLAAASGERSLLATAGLAIAKAILFVALMAFAGSKIVPLLLTRVVNTRSRELFVLVALTVAVGTALASAKLFGVSLALGAFVAGVVVSESPFSHQISADLLPFREAFAVIFFVSVGMLVDPVAIVTHWPHLIVLLLVAIVGKALVSGLVALALGSPGKTVLVLAAGRSQVGEFSFIIGQTGLSLGLLNAEHYSLILATAIVSITLNPFLVRLVDPLEQYLSRTHRPFWTWLDRHGAPDLPPAPKMTDHIVIVGCGRVGRHIAEVLGRLEIPRLVVEADPTRIRKLQQVGVPVLYGHAGSSEILEQAGLDRARALVVTLPDDATALAVVATARAVAPDLRTIVRASTWHGAQRLKAEGVLDIVRPELEGGIEIVRRTLLGLNLPFRDVQRYAELVRREGLTETDLPSAEQARLLDHLVAATAELEVDWQLVQPGCRVAGRPIGDSHIRSATGASIVAISRASRVIPNPGPHEVLHEGDRVALIGTTAQVQDAERLFAAPPTETAPEAVPDVSTVDARR